MPKITRRVIEGLVPLPSPLELLVWDTELRGFGVRMMPTGVASYVLKYRNAEGRQRKLVLGRLGAMTPDEARRAARAKLAEISKGEDPSAQRKKLRSSITMNELCDRYLDDAKSFIKAATWANNESKIRRHIKPLLGAHTVASLTSADVVRMQADIIAGKTAAKREGRGGVTSGGKAAAGRTVATLRIVLEFGKAHGVVQANAAAPVKKPPIGRRTRFLNFDEIERFGAALQMENEAGSEVGCAAIRFLLLSGCRRMEALTLRTTYLDRNAGCVRLPDTKTGAQTRPIGASAFAALDDVADRNGWVFPAYRGDGHFVGAPKLLARVAERAGLDGISVHTLRHSFASAAAALGFSQPVIAGLLGHTLGGVTAIYTHMVDKTLVAAADQVSARIAAALAGEQASASMNFRNSDQSVHF